VSVSAGSEGVDPSLDLSEGRTGLPGGDASVSEPHTGVRSDASVSEADNGATVTERDAGRMVLTEGQHRTEATLLAWMAIEFIRVVEPADSGVTTGYVNQVADNARLLSGANARLYMSLLRSQLKWVRRLPSGLGELR
jgi:hypothetical protein